VGDWVHMERRSGVGAVFKDNRLEDFYSPQTNANQPTRLLLLSRFLL